MHFSRTFKSSPHCSPSPDGELVATLSGYSVTIRSVDSLQTANSVKLPTDLPGPVSSLIWSPSSSKILVAAADQIHVFSVSPSDSPQHATILNTGFSGAKPPVIRFGARDTEVLVWSPFGLKLAIFDLSTSKAVELTSPKFFQSTSATRGLSLRPDTAHLALLTRVGGKDLVSIHHPTTRQIQRSWYPDTTDAQGLVWTPDGRWLLLWESPAHGHRLLLYTADGQHFRSLGPSTLSPEPDADLEPGIKLCRLSPNAEWCAVCDHSRGVAILGTQAWRLSMRLLHPITIVPKDTMQVWQEQLSASPEARSSRTFLRATQMVSPPGRMSDARTAPDLKPGCSAAAFDASSTLLATKLDDSPGTLWIWDVAATELRAVLIFYGAVNFSWHPSSRELLLVTCQDEAHQNLSYIWDPVSNGPTPVATDEHLANAGVTNKTESTWIPRETERPLLLASDAQQYVLVSLADADQMSTPWQQTEGSEWTAGSGLSLGPGGPEHTGMVAITPDDTSVLDDTFSFRNT